MTDSPNEAGPQGAEKDHSARNARILKWLVRATSLAALKVEVTALAHHLALRAALQSGAMVLWALVAVFLLAALVAWLSALVGPIAACLIVAAVFAIAAVIVQGIAQHMARSRPRLHFHWPEMANVAPNGVMDDAAIGALSLAALAGLFMGLRGKS